MKTIFFLFLAISFFSCGNKQETIQPHFASITESVYAVGSIKSKNQYEAHALVGGTIESYYVKEGDYVKIGDPLVKISNLTQQLNSSNAQLNASYADLKANQYQLEDAFNNIQVLKNKAQIDSLNYLRQQNLWKQNIGSQAELEQREIAHKNSKNNYQSALIRYENLKRQLVLSSNQSKNNLKIAKNQENDFVLKSEVDGMVFKIYKEKGELINQQVPLILLGNSQEYILEMQVDENDIFKIELGQKVLITMDSYKGEVFEANVVSMDKVMNEKSKSFIIEAEFTKAPKKLFPSISFEANIILQEKKKAMLIPRNYLINQSFVIRKNGDTVKVKTGLKDYRMVEIISGISENDELILPQ